MGQWDVILGPILIASWINSALFAIEITQIRTYFKRYNDPIIIKIAVLVSLLFDILGIISGHSAIYEYSVTHFGDEKFAFTTVWGMTIMAVAGGINAIMCQALLIWRLFMLTQNYYICGFLSAGSLLGLAGSLAGCISTFLNGALSHRTQLFTIVIIWLASEAVIDVLLAGTLVWYLRLVKTSFAKTESLLYRLTRTAIETGSATSLVAVAGLALFLIYPTNNLCLIFVFPLGRIYSLTMLYNLNQRQSLAAADTLAGTTKNNRSRTGLAFDPSGIHVSRHAVTRSEGVQDVSPSPDYPLNDLGSAERSMKPIPYSENGTTKGPFRVELDRVNDPRSLHHDDHKMERALHPEDV